MVNQTEIGNLRTINIKVKEIIITNTESSKFTDPFSQQPLILKIIPPHKIKIAANTDPKTRISLNKSKTKITTSLATRVIVQQIP